jgi:protoheme ferro-lyase
MHVNDLKYNLLDKLISVRDLDILQKINDLIGGVDINSPIFKITDAQKQMLTKSEEDIRNGNVISNDDLNAEEDQWLNG